jgi:hypothetical protein
VLRDYEGGTSFDMNGRIAFTNNRDLTGAGISDRKDFEAWQAHLNACTDISTFKHAATRSAFTTEAGTRVPALPEPLRQEIAAKKLIPFPHCLPGEPRAPFDVRDREKDMRWAYEFFSRELGFGVKE